MPRSPSWERRSDMLTIVNYLGQLRFGALMEIYQEGNRENGEMSYPDLSPHEQLMLAEQDFYTFLSECFFRQPDAAYYVWSDNGRYVSALRLEPYRDGLLLEALETHPEFRRRGYAKLLVRSVLETIGEHRVYSHISPHNAPSLAAHKSCGFQKILDYAVYVDGSVNNRCDTYLYENPRCK